MPLIVQGEFGFATEESFKAFKETSDKRFLLSRTTIVIEKKGNNFTGFLMTIIPDKDYQLANDFKTISSSYKKLQKGFSGSILYHNLNGSFSNGWVLLEGKIIQTIKHKDNNEFPIQLISKGCWAYYYVTWGCTEAQSDKGIDALNCKYYETWDYLYTLCDGEGGGGGSGGGGATEAIYLGEPDKPCDGNPLFNLSIASPGSSGIMGGMFGCVRSGSDYRCVDKDYHGGIDFACDPGTPVYSIKGGVVNDFVNTYEANQAGDGSSVGDLGNYVTVRYTNIDGNTKDVTYAHLNFVSSTMEIGDPVNMGDAIGLSGRTGNAVTAPEAHVHIQIFQDGQRVDPAGYFGATIWPSGEISDPCPSY